MSSRRWYEFRDEAERLAAEADFRALTAHVVEKHHGDEADAAEELREIVMTHPHLQALAVNKYVTYIVETDPLIQQHLRNAAGEELAGEKKTASKK